MRVKYKLTRYTHPIMPDRQLVMAYKLPCGCKQTHDMIFKKSQVMDDHYETAEQVLADAAALDIRLNGCKVCNEPIKLEENETVVWERVV